MRPRAWHDERGVALLAVMTASSLLLVLGLSLALTATVEVGISSNQRDGVQVLHAADAGVERAMADLAAADWDAVLTGAVTSGFFDGRVGVTLPDGSRLDVGEETDRLIAEPRPWGRNNPRWTVFASGGLAGLLPDTYCDTCDYRSMCRREHSASWWRVVRSSDASILRDLRRDCVDDA